MGAAKQGAHGIRIGFSARLLHKTGAVEYIGTLITICASSARNRPEQMQALVACYPASGYFVATAIHSDVIVADP